MIPWNEFEKERNVNIVMFKKLIIRKTDEMNVSNSLNWLKTMISQNYGFDPFEFMTNRET